MTAGTRILIIAFSLAIVVLGLQPLKGRYNGANSKFSKYVDKFLGDSLNFDSLKIPEELSVEVGKPNGRSISDKWERSSKESKEVAAFDKIESKDKNALENLLEKLSK